jgi:hypothetical protein
MNDKYEVKIVENFGNWSVSIYIIEKGSKPSLASIKDGNLEFTEIIPYSADTKPTLILPKYLWDIMKHTIIDDKVREKSEVEAELGATKYHLEDMRKLLKLK